MKIVNETEFDAELQQGLVLVDFYADWCGPCRMMGPILEEIATALEGRVTVCKVNVDQSEALARRFGVMSIPTLILLEDGQVREKHIGLWQKDDAIETISGYLDSRI